MKLHPAKDETATVWADASAELEGRLGFERGRFAGQAFAVTYSVCTNPCCGCAAIRLNCAPERDPGRLYTFELDVVEQRFEERPQASADDVALAEAFLAEATPEHWTTLRAVFWAAKRRVMKDLDVGTLEGPFPTIVKDGLLVGYAQCFPWAEGFVFERKGVRWVVDDQYCLRAGCPCTQTGLTFIRQLTSKIRSPAQQRPPLFLLYDYAQHGFSVEQARHGCPDPKLLVACLRSANPDLDRTLRRRHEQLRHLRHRLKPRRGTTPGNYHAAQESTLPPAPLPVVLPPKPGRDDPCPCGSGKKFKICCGAHG
jgi:hypothetical protein